MQAKLDKYGRMTIPKAVRDHLGLAPGTTFDVVLQGGGIRLIPVAGDSAPADGSLTARVSLPEGLRWKRLEKLSSK